MTISAALRITIVICTFSVAATGENLNLRPGLWEVTTEAKGRMMTTADAE